VVAASGLKRVQVRFVGFVILGGYQ
jgi:hypothetical protein